MTKAWLDGRMQLEMNSSYDDVYTAEDHEAWVQGRKDLENGDAVDGEVFLSSLLAAQMYTYKFSKQVQKFLKKRDKRFLRLFYQKVQIMTMDPFDSCLDI